MLPAKDITNLDMFCGRIDGLMPDIKIVPNEFKRGHTKWNRLFQDWFFAGLKTLNLTPKPGINQEEALAHIRAIMKSWEPKHEHKEAICAYLLSEWFEDVSWEANK